MDHPTNIVPTLVNQSVDVEFYLSSAALEVTINGQLAYYPPLDENGVIPGIVVGRVFKDAVYPPDITTYRSPLIGVKNGIELNLKGFNLG